MADYHKTGTGYTGLTRTSHMVTDLIGGFGGADADEVQVLNGLLALGYDPALVASLSDADPNRKFLGDAVVRALRSGISESDIKKALAFNKVAVESHDPSLRVQGLAEALGLDSQKVASAAVRRAGMEGRAQPSPQNWIDAANEIGGFTSEGATLFNQFATSQQGTYLAKGETRQNAPGPAGPAGAVPTATKAPVGPVGGPRMQITGPAPMPGGVTMGRQPAPATRGTTPAGGGGTPPPVDTTVKLAPNASPAETLQFIKEHYGYSAWIFEHPDVANVLIAAAKDGHWSTAHLQGELENTEFFKTHIGKTVEWLNTDAATQTSLVDKKVNEVISKAQALGMDLDPARAHQIAVDAKMYDWDETQLTKAVGHEYHYNPTMAQKGVAKQVRDTAALYGIPMTDAGLDDWGRRLGAGDATADDFKATLIGQAKALFPTLAADLDRNLTVKDIFDPYAKLAATTLGVDENTIDILDPKWQRPLQSTDGKNPTRMSTFDWTKTLKTEAVYNWDQTDNARQEASSFAHQIRQSFGLA